jgi:galactosamine-6-phosphate isomerase
MPLTITPPGPASRSAGAGALRLGITVAASYEAMSQQAANLIVAELAQRPDLLCCVSAGSTPTRTYELLAVRRARQPALFDRLRILKIDEWGGLALDDPVTCEAYVQEHVVKPLAVSQDRYEGFCSRPADPQAECERIRHWLDHHGPIDVCMLGLGGNGHLALNEPADRLRPHAHVSALTESSLQHPMLRSGAGKPAYGLTLGMADILRSRLPLLLVSGPQKRGPLRRLVEPAIEPQFPASFLWLHPNAVVLCDREAAAELDPAAYGATA